MRVLGLDPGSRRTGFGVVERDGSRFRCVDCGHVAPDPGLDLAGRLLAIVRAVERVMDRCAPACVVVEQAFYHESVRSTLVLGHVRGALLATAAGRGLPVAEYSPREIKLSVAGSGAAAKPQVAFMVCRLLGLAAAPQADAADALAGAICHLQRARFRAPAPAVRPPAPAARRLQALIAAARAR